MSSTDWTNLIFKQEKSTAILYYQIVRRGKAEGEDLNDNGRSVGRTMMVHAGPQRMAGDRGRIMAILHTKRKKKRNGAIRLDNVFVAIPATVRHHKPHDVTRGVKCSACI